MSTDTASMHFRDEKEVISYIMYISGINTSLDKRVEIDDFSLEIICKSQGISPGSREALSLISDTDQSNAEYRDYEKNSVFGTDKKSIIKNSKAHLEECFNCHQMYEQIYIKILESGVKTIREDI